MLPQKIFVLLILIGWTTFSQASESRPSLLIANVPDLGEVFQFAIFDAEIEALNSSDSAVTINGIDDRTGSIVLKHPITIAPHASVSLPLEIQIKNRIGVSHVDGNLKTSDGVGPVVGVNFFAKSVLSEAHPVVDFENVNAGESVSKNFLLTSDILPDVRFKRILDVGNGFTAVMKDDRTIAVSTKPDLSWGTHLEYLKLSLNSTFQKELWVRLKADVRGEIVPSFNPLDFGVVRQGDDAEEVVILTNKTGKDVDIDSVHFVGIDAAFVVQPCANRGCANLKIRIGKDQALGQIYGVAEIKFKGTNHTLPLNLRGLVLSRDQKIIDLTSNIQSEKNASRGPAKVDLKSQLQKTIKESSTPIELPGSGPLLKWTVQNELGIYGYSIHRADSEAGPFRRVNTPLTKAVNAGDRFSSDYQWRDNDVEPGKEYWYYISSVYQDGHSQQLTGPQKVIAKERSADRTNPQEQSSPQGVR